MSVDGGPLGILRPTAGSELIKGLVVLVLAVAIGAVLLSQGVTEDAEVTAPAPAGDVDAGPDGGSAPTTPTDDGTSDPTTPTEVRQPAEVRVLILNGSGKAGEAARGAQFFADRGYVAADPGNAAEQGPSMIWFAEGYAAEAEAAAAALGVDPAAVVKPLDPAAPPSDDLQDAHLVVVAGSDGVIAF